GDARRPRRARPAPGAGGRVRNHDVPPQDARGPRADDPRGERPPARQGGLRPMSVAAISHPDATLGEPMRQKLAGFARTLRDNGFKVGLAEPRDALEILAGPPGTRAISFKPALRALFCATHSDWDRFDEIFDAYWQGRHIRQARMLADAPSAAPARARRIAE